MAQTSNAVDLYWVYLSINYISVLQPSSYLPKNAEKIAKSLDFFKGRIYEILMYPELSIIVSYMFSVFFKFLVEQ